MSDAGSVKGRRILVVEDGHEYSEAIARLAPEGSALEIVRAGSLEEARIRLSEGTFDAVLLDVVFDRTPEGDLAGDVEKLIDRFGGDRRRAVRHLAENQGFYVADALAGELSPGTPVAIAYDFSLEPERFEALRRRIPGLVGVPDGTSLTEVLRLLLP